MSKGTIIDHQGDGLYTVRLSYTREAIEAESSRIQSRLAELTTLVPQKKNELSDAEDVADGFVSQINALIPDYVADRDEHRSKLLELQRSLAESQVTLAKIKRELAELQAEDIALRKRLSMIDRVPKDKELDAWCADYSTSLEGDVGLADINDEGGNALVIEPGFDDGALYNPKVHGQLMAREAQSGPQVFFNAAILPGMQKWFPRYRVGKITRIEGDLCDIDLDPAESSAQDLDINKEDRLKDVPIQYMDCNGAVFEEDDTVLVRFFSGGPQVIGFVTNPKPCSPGIIAFLPAQVEDNGSRTEFGLPVIQDDPLGTPDGEKPAWFLTKKSSDTYEFTKYQEPLYGSRFWTAPDKPTLSWRGHPGKVRNATQSNLSFEWNDMFLVSARLFSLKTELINIAEIGLSGSVMGAGIASDRIIVMVLANDELKAVHYPWDGRKVTGAGNVAHSYDLDPDYVGISSFNFSDSGSKGVYTRTKRDDRSAVKVVRYDQFFGFSSEIIWERGIEGLAVRTFSGDGEPLPNGSYTAGTFSGSATVNQHDVPIYVDFIGNQERTLYIRHGLMQESDTENVENSGYYSQQTIARTQEQTSFVLDNGSVLATYGPAEEYSYYRVSDERDLPATMTLNEQTVSKQVTGYNMFVDIRQGVVMFEGEEIESVGSYSGAAAADGAISGSGSFTHRKVYEMYQNNSRIFRKTAQEYTLLSSSTPYRKGSFNTGGFTETTATVDLYGEYQEPLGWTEALLNVGFVEADNQIAATLALYWDLGITLTGSEELLTHSEITGYPDPSSDLFGGRDEMTFYALGRV